MTDPKDFKVVEYAGVGTGGGPKPHLYADLVELIELDSRRARVFVHVALLAQVAELAASIRDQHSTAYKELSRAITDGASKLNVEIVKIDFSKQV